MLLGESHQEEIRIRVDTENTILRVFDADHFDLLHPERNEKPVREDSDELLHFYVDAVLPADLRPQESGDKRYSLQIIR